LALSHKNIFDFNTKINVKSGKLLELFKAGRKGGGYRWADGAWLQFVVAILISALFDRWL